MLSTIRALLSQFINDIDSGNSNISEGQQEEIINLLTKLTSQKLTKVESANYIGVCRATFDNYIDKNLIPEGEKRQGCNTLFWNKSDLDKFLEKHPKK